MQKEAKGESKRSAPLRWIFRIFPFGKERRKERRADSAPPETRDHEAFLRALESWNDELRKQSLWKDGEVQKDRHDGNGEWLWESLLIRKPRQIDSLQQKRSQADKLIKELIGPPPNDLRHGEQIAEPAFTFVWAAEAARNASQKLLKLGNCRLQSFRVLTILAFLFAVWLLAATLNDPTSNFSGTSAWPTIWLCFLTLGLGLTFLMESYFRLRISILEITRSCRLWCSPEAFPRPGDVSDWKLLRPLWRWIKSAGSPAPETKTVVHANKAWRQYREKGRLGRRLWRSIALMLAYVLLLQGVIRMLDPQSTYPFLRDSTRVWYFVAVNLAFLMFALLTFWTIDAARLCGWFVEAISQGPTLYPQATIDHFCKRRGSVPEHILNDWIDVHIIAQITGRVGSLLYFPAIILLLLLLAHHRFLYNWAWPPLAYGIAGANFIVAAASIVILQRAARRARDQSVRDMQEKLMHFKFSIAKTEDEKQQVEVSGAEKLLDEVRGLREGAFAGFWGNPVVGALLVPSGGAALIEIVHYFASIP